MSHLPVFGEHPVVPLPEREPAAIRAAVARLDPGALTRFEADWTAATGRGSTSRTHEDYRDDVVLVVRVQHFELSDPTG
jgi:hypothetical protein